MDVLFSAPACYLMPLTNQHPLQFYIVSGKTSRESNTMTRATGHMLPYIGACQHKRLHGRVDNQRIRWGHLRKEVRSINTNSDTELSVTTIVSCAVKHPPTCICTIFLNLHHWHVKTTLQTRRGNIWNLILSV